MAFNGDGQKLTGDDGFVKKATFGAEVAGDATTPLPVGTYLITKVAAVSTLPSAALGGLDPAPGDILTVIGSASITPAIDDDLVTLTLEDQCDVSSFAMEFTKEEIDVTVLCDDVKKYRAGKADMAGSINGVFTAGITDSTTGSLRQFISVAKQDGDVSFDRFNQAESILLGEFYVNIDSNIADIMKVVAPFQMFGQGLGGEIGAAQSFAASFRFANLQYTDSNGEVATILPTFYRIGDGT